MLTSYIKRMEGWVETRDEAIRQLQLELPGMRIFALLPNVVLTCPRSDSTIMDASKYVGMIFFIPGFGEDFLKVRKKKSTDEDEVRPLPSGNSMTQRGRR